MASKRTGERAKMPEGGRDDCGADIDAPSLSTPSSIIRIACDLSSSAFANEVFDLITCNMVVEHISEPQKMFGIGDYQNK
jgi:hypothetical protein